MSSWGLAALQLCPLACSSSLHIPIEVFFARFETHYRSGIIKEKCLELMFVHLASDSLSLVYINSACLYFVVVPCSALRKHLLLIFDKTSQFIVNTLSFPK